MDVVVMVRSSSRNGPSNSKGKRSPRRGIEAPPTCSIRASIRKYSSATDTLVPRVRVVSAIGAPLDAYPRRNSDRTPAEKKLLEKLVPDRLVNSLATRDSIEVCSPREFFFFPLEGNFVTFSEGGQ